MTRQRLGQHWLADHRVCEQIADTVALRPDETCIEIGGGKGSLTKELAGRSKRLIVYEIDSHWANHLREFGPSWVAKACCANPSSSLEGMAPPPPDACTLEIRGNDALDINWTRPDLGIPEGDPIVIAGNLPYYITSPFFLRLAYSTLDFERAIFLIQKEVAQKIASKSGSSEYGRLTVSLGAFLDTAVLFDVAPESFNPPPDVMSSVIKMTPRKPLLMNRERSRAFERTVQTAFHMRRKTLKNNIKAGFPDFDEKQIDGIIAGLDLKPTTRPQEVEIEKYVMLTDILMKP
jgi:16S rRNA (adenine1518-N6/adenine1519-N6)-dimethyltransferase